MRKVIFFCINCAWAMAHAQSYTYFDSICYPQPDWGTAVCNNLINESSEGYIIAGNAWNGTAFRPHIYKLNLDGSIQNTFFPPAPDMSISGWYGKEFIATSDGGYLWAALDILMI